MNCSNCSFNKGKECHIMKKKTEKCWAGCYSLEELRKRYEGIRKYSAGQLATDLAYEFVKFSNRLKELENMAG